MESIRFPQEHKKPLQILEYLAAYKLQNETEYTQYNFASNCCIGFNVTGKP